MQTERDLWSSSNSDSCSEVYQVAQDLVQSRYEAPPHGSGRHDICGQPTCIVLKDFFLIVHIHFLILLAYIVMVINFLWETVQKTSLDKRSL